MRRRSVPAWSLAAFLVFSAGPTTGDAQVIGRAGEGAEGRDPWTDAHLPEFEALYRQLHAHPELSDQEVATARRIAEEFRKAGAEVTTGVGRLGVVGVLRNGPGPTALLRTELDALPVVEA